MKKQKKNVPGGDCRMAMEVQAAVETLAAIWRGYLSRWLWFYVSLLSPVHRA